MTDTPETKKYNVLFVDDDKFLVDMYSMKFAHDGFNVEGCLSAKEALQVLDGGFTPDVVLFDLTMPEYDGFQFLQALKDKKAASGAIKIALTNQSDDSEKQKATELGVDHYIIKASMIPSEVVTAVQSFLAAKK